MSRPLAVVAVTGIAVSVVCLSIAAALNPGGTHSVLYGPGESWLDDLPWSPGIWRDSGGEVSRELAWRGGGIEVSIPGQVRFRRASGWRATVTGPQAAVERLRFADGRLSLEGSARRSGASSLEVELAGPSLDRVMLNGSGDVTLDDLEQSTLEVEIRGSGAVTATGSVESLSVRIVGSGDADLGALQTMDLDADIIGSGDAEAAPRGDASIRIVGSGDVRLLTAPRSVSSRITGSGEVVQAGAEPDRA